MNSIEKEIAGFQREIDVLLRSVRNITGKTVKHPSNKLSVILNKVEELKRFCLEEQHMRKKYTKLQKQLETEISEIEIPKFLQPEEQETLVNKKAALLKQANRLKDNTANTKKYDIAPLIEATRKEAKKECSKKDSDLSQKVKQIHSQTLLNRVLIASFIGVVAGGTYFALDHLKYHWSKNIPGATKTVTNTTHTSPTIATASTSTTTSTGTGATKSTHIAPPAAGSNSTSGGDLTSPIGDLPAPGDSGIPAPDPNTPGSGQSFDYTEVVTESVQDTMVNIASYNMSVPILYLIGIITAAIIIFAGLTYLAQTRRDRTKAKGIVQETAVLDTLLSKVMGLQKSEDGPLREKLDGLKETKETMNRLNSEINHKTENSRKPSSPSPAPAPIEENTTDLEALIASLSGNPEAEIEEPKKLRMPPAPSTKGPDISPLISKPPRKKEEEPDIEALKAILSGGSETSFAAKLKAKEEEKRGDQLSLNT